MSNNFSLFIIPLLTYEETELIFTLAFYGIMIYGYWKDQRSGRR